MYHKNVKPSSITISDVLAKRRQVSFQYPVVNINHLHFNHPVLLNQTWKCDSERSVWQLLPPMNTGLAKIDYISCVLIHDTMTSRNIQVLHDSFNLGVGGKRN